jgi:plasmid maintenance system antidote protein VapI
VAALNYGRSRLPELLNVRGTTKAEFARRMDFHPSMVSQIISGHKRFSLLQAKKASDILDCNIEDLYEWKIIHN